MEYTPTVVPFTGKKNTHSPRTLTWRFPFKFCRTFERRNDLLMEEIPNNRPRMYPKPLENNGINYQLAFPQLVDAGYLNHQQYFQSLIDFTYSNRQISYIWCHFLKVPIVIMALLTWVMGRSLRSPNGGLSPFTLLRPWRLTFSAENTEGFWLVVEPTHLKNMLVKLEIFPK